MFPNSLNILRSQRRNLYIFCLIALIIIGLIIWATTPNESPSAKLSKLDLPGDSINAQEIWMSRVEKENIIAKKQFEFFQNTLLELKKSENEKAQENELLKKDLEDLKKEMREFYSNIQNNKNITSSRNDNQVIARSNSSEEIKQNLRNDLFSHTEDPFLPIRNENDIQDVPRKPPLKEVVASKAKRNISNVDKAIPPGTTVKAILVSSIDAPCGVYSRSDPQPVKLRILDNAHLPKAVQAKLKGGLLIASAFGDISSERVYMRIESLTKVESNGEFIETSVTGFVSGEDGKFGVRGVVVDKSEKIITNAARSGFLGGLGNILQSAVGKHDVNQYSIDMVKSGCASGASNAFDMLSEYYIRRAEQVMPIIQVTAGRLVDITFTHQAELGDLYTKDKVKEIREKSRREDAYNKG